MISTWVEDAALVGRIDLVYPGLSFLLRVGRGLGLYLGVEGLLHIRHGPISGLLGWGLVLLGYFS